MVFKRRYKDWFNSNDEEIERLLKTKDELRKKGLGDSSEGVKQQYKRMRNKCRSKLRQMLIAGGIRRHKRFKI